VEREWGWLGGRGIEGEGGIGRGKEGGIRWGRNSQKIQLYIHCMVPDPDDPPAVMSIFNKITNNIIRPTSHNPAVGAPSVWFCSGKPNSALLIPLSDRSLKLGCKVKWVPQRGGKQ